MFWVFTIFALNPNNMKIILLTLLTFGISGWINTGTAQSGMTLHINGINSYMSVPDHDDLDINAGENFTVTLWIKTTSSADYYRIVNKRAATGTNPGYEMITQTGTGVFGMNLRSTTNVNAGPPFGTTSITDGEWHHLAMVVNVAAHTASIYVDGNPEQSSTSSAIGAEGFENALPFQIGVNGNQSVFMNASLDNIRVWQLGFTSADIQADMTSVVSGNEPGLLAAWDFENVTGTTVPDVKGSHPGTLYGGAAIIPLEGQMQYIGSAEVKTSLPVGRGEMTERIVSVKIQTLGNVNPLNLSALECSLAGTTDITDIDSLKVFFTGTNPRLVNGQLFGVAAVSQGNITISGTQLLSEGDNYFWLTGNIASEAQEGNFIAGSIATVTIEDMEYTVTPGSADDKRLVLLEHKLLFTGGDYGSANFRIPAIKTAKNGSLVAAVDARINGSGDLPNNIDIMIRTSPDKGETWTEGLTIADFGDFGASDPALVVDRNSGDIICMFASHHGLFQSTPSNPIRFQVCRSQNHGLTWSAPVDHTAGIYAPGWYASWLASGSAHQLRSGRMVGAVGVRQNSGNTISNFMIYSDDAGATWHYHPALASATGDEAKIVELDNGNLMMNIRNASPDCRKITVSQNGGDSWATPWYQYELIDPAVNGDFIRYTSVLDGYDKSRLLFSTASHPTIRKNLTIFLSYDEGSTWTVSKVINPGPAAYSSLTILDDGTIGCLYENGEYEEYQIYFARLSLDWLTDGMDTYTPPVRINHLEPTDIDLNIVPNPANKTIQITYNLDKPSSVNASIVSSSGQELVRLPEMRGMKTYSHTLDVSAINPGLYFLKTSFEGNIISRKLLVTN